MQARRNDGASTTRQLLSGGWEICSTGPNECATPAALESASRHWIAATVPSTAASSLQAAGQWSLDGAERRFDAEDWWYRLQLDLPDDAPLHDAMLEFDGLATLCEVWLNGQTLLTSDNMFAAHSVPASGLRPGRNVLHLVFRSLDADLKKRRPRSRWRAPMIENQQLRWHRTTVLGRTPGWSPPCAPVGPWKPIALRTAPDPVEATELRAELDGNSGVVRFSGQLHAQDVRQLVLVVQRNGVTVASDHVRGDADKLRAEVRIKDVALWFPHTHGEPVLYDVLLRGLDAQGDARTLPLGPVGFRRIERRAGNANGFGLAVNDVDVFCRGACWTPLDVVSLHTDHAALRVALEQVVAAGFNMLRISGAFVYEDEEFFALCDELGVLIWQDFMFANMDYPATDDAFMASVKQEAEQHLAMWARHPSVAVICGNSEVSQQAAMWGAPRELWSPALFADTLNKLAAEHCQGVPYWPSSAFGGDIPHQVDAGITSYYGVGAYLRGVDDLRRSGLKFATESLGFANIPEQDTLDGMPGGATLRVHHPIWKRRAPRDLGAGWDFDDVRDHYLREFFGVDPLQLRYADHARYLELSRRVPAEAMTAAFTEWRRPGSSCGGALVWFLRDLWPGAGWGIVDAHGEPKAPYHALRRMLQPQWIGITDEGLNGLAVHIANESPRVMSAELDLALYRGGQHLITRAQRGVAVDAHSAVTIRAASLLGEFHDLTHAYRFGPLSCDLVVATLVDARHGTKRQAFHLPYAHLHSSPSSDCVLTARARPGAGARAGQFELTVRASGFARSVHIDAPGYAADEQYFDLAPGAEAVVTLRARSANVQNLAGTVGALNAGSAARIEVVT